MTLDQAVFEKRRAGILLHPTSLPGGVVGPDAYYFVDWLVTAGFSIWQMLPLGPVHEDRSPYQCLSAHAGNAQLISGQFLKDQGWLDEQACANGAGLVAAFQAWQASGGVNADAEFCCFAEHHQAWLHDYALFRVIREQQNNAGWFHWPEPLRDRDDQALSEIASSYDEQLLLIKFEQYVFYQQWLTLKSYANERGVQLFGDMPIFVAYDSADVWAQREFFLLDELGQPTVVAGVPPDYFSETGQRWGNPLYDWQKMETTNFAWWKQRFHSQLELFDLIRIDHFRGFEAYWEINAQCETAMDGRWVKAPGQALFEEVQSELGELPLVAEDLGIITPEVEALRDQFHFPGMKILHFAFGGDALNPYLPHNHVPQSICYTGTHDNDTTLGWYANLDEHTHVHMNSYLGYPSEKMPWPLIRAALASVSLVSVLPMQDVLQLDGSCRMNTPGTTENNWLWQFSWEQVDDSLAANLKEILNMYRRLV